ncbi:MAG: 3'-5' exonuclease [Candidatus Caldipriscus sp.]|jgi:DNA polymerase III epsilon subunit family exonuclease
MVRDLVFLDLETTGLDFSSDRIVEVGLVRMGGERKRILINPRVPIKKRAYSIHGISFDEVKGSPYFEEVRDEILDFIGDSFIVGFNIINFDIPFLNYELVRSGGRPILNGLIDLKEIGRFFFENPPNSLYSFAKLLRVRVERLHRALEDAETTRRIFLKLMEIRGDIFSDPKTLERISLSSFPEKSIRILEMAREYGSLRIKYFAGFEGVKEVEGEPFVILKNIVILRDFGDSVRKLNVSRVIEVSAL